jgi:hypothetical protein
VFPVRYELNSYILFRKKSVFEGGGSKIYQRVKYGGLLRLGTKNDFAGEDLQ